jgi:hypothetical protein
MLLGHLLKTSKFNLAISTIHSYTMEVNTTVDEKCKSGRFVSFLPSHLEPRKKYPRLDNIAKITVDAFFV